MSIDVRMTRPRRHFALAASAAVAASGLLAAPAAAQPAMRPDASVCLQYQAWATGCFEKTGDHVLVWDNRTDGLRAQVKWSTDYGRSGTCAIPAGSDSRDCNYDFRENRGIRFQLNMIDTQTGEVVWAVYEDTTT
ncbi:MAG TPA: hypothetical protein VNP20_17700 [Nocardioidaceae bacterium]|nr:hypothetical protein [Nocardioidaceae bacterium]